MKGRDVQICLDIVAAPRTALERIAATAPIGPPLVVLGALQAVILVAQGALLQPALRADPMLADADASGSVWGGYWAWRVASILAWPVACAARAIALATVLQCAAVLLGGAMAWRRLLSTILYLDFVFWLEGVAVTLLLWTNDTGSLEALSQLRLHAGLNWFWHPRARLLAAGLEAANAFTVWWGVLLGLGLRRALGLPKSRAAIIAGLAWAGLVLVRAAVAPR
jgi:hypothetical protein